ncbi:unnamed protein product [Plutella xylostella]|uniref:(diamondback moth) hypothetical protein n=1 Tax=Plutella xylostella TaxID=51655 RepID=A0A8S4EF91_PLUXY|nr:unnamed protein product [Plutella xylostella]
MDPQRSTLSGPMAPALAYTAKKTGPASQHRPCRPGASRDVTEVHSRLPAEENTYLATEQHQIYYGRVNLINVIDTGTNLTCCKYTEDRREVAAGFADGAVRLFDAASGRCSRRLRDAEVRASPAPVTAIKHRPLSTGHPVTETFLVTYLNGNIKCWKYRYEQCLYTIREKRQTLGLAYHPRGPKFLTCGDDATLLMYDEEVQTEERSFYASGFKNVIDGHTSLIQACAFHPRAPHELASGGQDARVLCWDERQPYATRHIIGPRIVGEGLDFDKTGQTILTCSWDLGGSLQLWDYGSCRLIETVRPDEVASRLHCGRFVPRTGLVVCGGGGEDMLRVVNLCHGETVCSIRNNPGAVAGLDLGAARRGRRPDDSCENPSDILACPAVAYVAGKRLVTVDFG